MSFAYGGQGPNSLVGAGWGGSPLAEPFPDPYMDHASTIMPESMPHALRWCEFVFMNQGTYREAARRMVTYFITDVELQDASDDTKTSWKKFLDETLDIKNFLHIVGLDATCYGNSFISVIPTYVRYMLCPRCRTIEKPFRQLVNEPIFKFRWHNFEFCADCPKCSYSGPWRHYERPSGEHNGFRLKRWNPHDIELLFDPWTDEVRYLWKIPEYYRQQIKKGKPDIVLEHVPTKVLEAVKNDHHLLFEKDFIHHTREDALAGVNNRGWGISKVLTNFRQAYYVQVLHRYNEAIALDYVIPFRLLTPAPGDKNNGGDPLTNMNAGGFMANIHSMLRKRNRNPTGWHTMPFPVQYQALGGDAKALAPDTLIAQGMDTLLNNIGIPAEMFKASLTMQAAPTALRLFEASNTSIPHNFNSILQFIVRKSSSMLRWETVKAKMMRVTHADDANRQMSKLQLSAGGSISQTTGLAAVGVDFKDEIRQMMDDQRFQAEQQAKLQDQMDQSAQMQQMAQQPQPGQPGQPGQPQQGGAPMDPNQQPGMAGQSIMAGLPQGPNQQVTPEELLGRAQYMAQQLMGMPESQKDSELIKLKKVDPTLHSLVKSQINDIRQQAKTQGGSQVLAQQFGKQGEAATTQTKAASALRKVRNIRRIQLPD